MESSMDPASPPQTQPSAPGQTVNPLPQGQVPPVAKPVVPRMPPATKTSSGLWPALLVISVVLFIGFVAFVGLYVAPRVGNLIVIQNQRIERKIHIDKVTVTTPSFLVIQPLDSNTNSPSKESVYASTGYLAPDIYENFDLTIDESAPEVMVPGTILYATLYKDSNRDRIFQLIDNAGAVVDNETVRDLLGNVVRIEFQAK